MKFLNELSKIVNTGQSRSIILSGNVYDLFFDGQKYVPLLDLLKVKFKLDQSKDQKGIAQLVLQVNRPIEIVDEKHSPQLEASWASFRKSDDKKPLRERLAESYGNPIYALELMRQITEISRKFRTTNNLLMIIEAADMLVPESEIARMQMADRRQVAIVHDWFSDPNFMNGHDTVILLSESRHNIHHRISKLPSVLSVDISLPTFEQRAEAISFFANELKTTVVANEIAAQTSGLSIHAIRQLICSGDFSAGNIAKKVEEYMVGQLGDGVIEFKRPTHTLDKVVGFSKIKKFLQEELIPAFRADDDSAISGAAVGGPIGGGKTFICEAVASEIGVPVITLKNIRSKWYGETDQIFERLKRLLESFHKIVIFVDEADTMFGDVQSDQDTERRLTGKIQAMMSDPVLKGKVIWFLMTARIHRLSPDIRRPGRMDLIIPILDPVPHSVDHVDFVKWTFGEWTVAHEDALVKDTVNFSSATFAMVRSRIKAKQPKNIEEVVKIVQDILSPDIEETREYQSLQAQMNCTRKSLLVDYQMTITNFEGKRKGWKTRIKQLESMGVN